MIFDYGFWKGYFNPGTEMKEAENMNLKKF